MEEMEGIEESEVEGRNTRRDEWNHKEREVVHSRNNNNK